jgi:hypothetical protein
LEKVHTMIIIGHPECSFLLVPELAHPVQINVERFD